ncbi:hypothetical protein NQ315_002471, partial [Exocentrus adspersus]
VHLVVGAVFLNAVGIVFGVPSLYSDYHGEYAASYDNYVPRPYAFEYGVSDPHTGDHKSQWETKDAAGVVRGSYSLLEPDGTTRIVDYIADDHGFRAVVRKIGIHGQSVESHGGAVETSAVIQPIVVPEAQQIPIHVEQPIQATQPLGIDQSVYLQQPILQGNIGNTEVWEQGPIFQSYDGNAKHYQTLLPQQNQYTVQLPKTESVYIESPKQEFGWQESYVQPLAQPEKLRIYSQEPQLVSGPAVPKEVYYTLNTEFGSPGGKSAISFNQPETVITSQEKLVEPVILQKNVYNQNQLQYPATNVKLVEPYQNQWPIQNQRLESSYPSQNQILVQNQEQNYGQINGGGWYPQSETSQNQGYQGITGNLQDDSEYTNYS